MIRMIGRRLWVFLPTLLLITIVTFSLRAIIPGGPAEALAGAGASRDALDAINERYGLDRPLWIQYFDWMAGIVRGDLGTSYATGQPVWDLLQPRVASTVEVVLGGLVVAVIFGGVGGMIAAIARDRWYGKSIFAVSSLGVSVPVFWLSAIAAGLIGATWGLLPANGFVPLSDGLIPHLRSVAMPILLIALPSFALFLRQVRSSMTTVLDSPYIRTAHALGVSRRRIYLDLAPRNAAGPVISIVPFLVAVLVGELVIIDDVFVLPGFGSAIIDAVQGRDFATLQAIVLIMSVTVLTLTLLADVLLMIIDPRRRKEFT